MERSDPTTEPVLIVLPIEARNGRPARLVARFPLEPGQAPGMERALVWTTFARGHYQACKGTERELVELLGPPSETTIAAKADPVEEGP